MGFRLNVEPIKLVGEGFVTLTTLPEFYGTKLIGYVDDHEEELRCVRYFRDRLLVSEDEVFTYGYCPPVILSPEQFREWINLYFDDWCDFYRAKFSEFRQSVGEESYANLRVLYAESCYKLVSWV